MMGELQPTSDTDESILELCTLEHFSKLKQDPALKAFITAQNALYKTKSSVPAKGTLDEAKDGVRKSILVAYESKQMPNLLLDSFPYELSTDEEGEDDTIEHEQVRVC